MKVRDFWPGKKIAFGTFGDSFIFKRQIKR